MKNTTLSLLIFFLLFAGIAYIDHMLREVDKAKVIRDCSMTRVHIIDDNTLISCTVLKVNRTETPVQGDKKPEISL